MVNTSRSISVANSVAQTTVELVRTASKLDHVMPHQMPDRTKGLLVRVLALFLRKSTVIPILVV
jgi:hypothetical protein